MSLGRSMRRCNRFHVFVITAALLFITLVVFHHPDTNENNHSYRKDEYEHLDKPSDGNAEYYFDTNDLVRYRRDTPLIWIGGVPRSGTTLMRAMLDAHDDVRCGEETRIIPRILGFHGFMKSEKEMTRLKEAHIDESVINSALGAYILSIISLHGEPATRLCNKDPFSLRSISHILTLFPKAKFIFMIRDGRATAHSLITRDVKIAGFDLTSYRSALRNWNRAIKEMNEECEKIGANTCLPVYYEQLVLHPEAQMRRILQFLDIPFSDNVLHHEQMVGGQVSLSKTELSTDQVDKPVNIGALANWVNDIPDDVKRSMDRIAPMLEQLGYDPNANPPNYGTPDKSVLENSKHLELKSTVFMKPNDIPEQEKL